MIENTEGAIKKDNPEKLTTLGTQDKDKQMLENTEGAIKKDNPENWQHRRRKTKQQHYMICVGHHNMQTNENNVNKI
jgi:hypothetical protein